jgi:hypothetical protein
MPVRRLGKQPCKYLTEPFLVDANSAKLHSLLQVLMAVCKGTKRAVKGVYFDKICLQAMWNKATYMKGVHTSLLGQGKRRRNLKVSFDSSVHGGEWPVLIFTVDSFGHQADKHERPLSGNPK